MDTDRLRLEFSLSAPDRRHAPPPDLPEVAIAGRSNAGKSSVLNRLSGSRKTAKTSRTPGRTQLLNFFNLIVSGVAQGRFVDLPGYGYAKVSASAQASWQRAVNDYLENREALIGIVLVMDIRHPLQDFDQDLLRWATDVELPVQVLLNKADKLKSGAQKRTLQTVRQALSTYGTGERYVDCFSALRGQGQDLLIARLNDWLQRVEPLTVTEPPDSAANPSAADESTAD
ncbi:MAG: ribosome biogenesis GTP-binding protein YihA/YsxC [Pseudomonadota bacterium]